MTSALRKTVRAYPYAQPSQQENGRALRPFWHHPCRTGPSYCAQPDCAVCGRRK